MPSRTGVDVIREALRQRAMKGSLAFIARDLSIAVNNLNAFTFQGADLPNDQLQLLAEHLFGGAAIYDVVTKLLKSANTAEPAVLSMRPDPILPKPVDTTPRPGPVYASGPKPPPAAPRTRPGWAN